jgi:hypothetical protein
MQKVLMDGSKIVDGRTKFADSLLFAFAPSLFGVGKMKKKSLIKGRGSETVCLSSPEPMTAAATAV